jgi:hypothetical protein
LIEFIDVTGTFNAEGEDDLGKNVQGIGNGLVFFDLPVPDGPPPGRWLPAVPSC